MRPNRFEIDLDAIAHNTREIRRAVGSDTQLFAALKGNAYGFGLVEVAEVVLESGANALTMADVRDAVLLRHNGVSAPILLYAGNLPEPAVIEVTEDLGLIPTVVDLPSAKAYAARARKNVDIFVKVDVGLERVGVYPDQAVAFIQAVSQLSHLSVEGIYTHLHVAPGSSKQYVHWQFQRFRSVLDALQSEGIEIPITMAASSPVLRMGQSMNLNAVDPGRLLYGMVPPGPGTERFSLRRAFGTLTSRLIQIKCVHRTEFLDSAPFSVQGVECIGIIPCGRADGLEAVNSGKVLLHGQKTGILGSPHLEHTRVDLTGLLDARVGDEVVIIGRQGPNEITIEDVIAHQRRVPEYMLALEVRDSVRRVYRRHH